MAILMPVLGRARKQARAIACQANLRQWGMAMHVYAQDNEGELPTGGGGTSAIWLLRGSFTPQADPNTTGHALHHFGTQGIALCPEANHAAEGGSYPFAAPSLSNTERDSGSGGARVIAGSTFESWTITDPPPSFRGSYGFNQYLFHGFSSAAGQPVNIDVLSLREASSIPLLLDGALPMGKPRDNDLPPYHQGSTIRMGGFCLNRHNGNVNSLFLDWSVRRVGLKALWTLKWYKEFDRANRWTKAGGVQPDDWPEWMKDY
jgi:prepilin-type processing-associated H-X9-DG protein